MSNSTTLQKIGSAVAQIRHDMELTQRDFAEKLEMSQTKLSLVERGLAELHADELVKIMTVFNVQLDSLMKGRAIYHRKRLRVDPHIDKLDATLNAVIEILNDVRKQLKRIEK